MQLEEAQGARDEEAQQALRALQQQMSTLEHAQKSASERSLSSQPASSGTASSDIEIARSIDRCFCGLHLLQLPADHSPQPTFWQDTLFSLMARRNICDRARHTCDGLACVPSQSHQVDL